MQKNFSFARFSITTRVLRAICAPFVRFPEQTGIPVASRYRPLLCGYPFHPGHFHNQADHKPIVPAVARVAQRAGKYRAALRLPRRVQQKLTRIAVGLRRALLGFTRHQLTEKNAPAAPAMLPDAFSQSGPPPDESAHSESTRQ